MDSFMNSCNYTLQPNNSSAVAARENMERDNMRRTRVLEQQYASDKRRKDFNAFTSESKDFLLTESLNYLLRKCLPENITESLAMNARAVVESFVKEETSFSLLNRFKTKTLLLSELANVVETTHQKVLHGAEGKDAPFKISNSDMKAFHSKLESLDCDQVTKEIVSRVTKAEEEFVKANVKDKETLEELSDATNKKLEGIKNKDEEKEKLIKQECAAMYRRKVDNLMNRKKGILESIVLRMSRNIVTEDTLLPSFTQENGKLDMQKIIDTSEVMYTFMEMVNTMRIKDVNTSYLNEILSSIK